MSEQKTIVTQCPFGDACNARFCKKMGYVHLKGICMRYINGRCGHMLTKVECPYGEHPWLEGNGVFKRRDGTIFKLGRSESDTQVGRSNAILQSDLVLPSARNTDEEKIRLLADNAALKKEVDELKEALAQANEHLEGVIKIKSASVAPKLRQAWGKNTVELLTKKI